MLDLRKYMHLLHAPGPNSSELSKLEILKLRGPFGTLKNKRFVGDSHGNKECLEIFSNLMMILALTMFAVSKE